VNEVNASRRALCLSAAVLSAGCVAPFADKNATMISDKSELSRALAAIVNDPAMPLASLSVVAMKQGEVVYRNAFGLRHIPSNTAATPDTLYRIASISKLITALGAMTLVDAGTLDLDRDISAYLGYAVRNPHFPNVAITTRMLMNHTSSLRDEAGYFWSVPATLQSVLMPGGALHGKGEMWATNAAPGGYFEYANLPWGVLGNVMERITNERFDRFMTRVLLAPLGIDGGFHPADFAPQSLQKTATLYRKRTADEKEIWDAKGPWIAQVDDYSQAPPVPRAKNDYVIGSNGTAMSPQGGARLSVDGLTTLMRMLMNGGVEKGVRVLSARAVAEMLRVQWQFDAAKNNGKSAYGDTQASFNAWGLGNQHFTDVSGPNRGDRLIERGGFTGVGHLGDAYGLTSAFAFNAEKREGLIFLCGGVGVNPETQRGVYSSFYRYEERILTALYEGAIR
jgi:CubicO group peptidase (beta-lactamase class C family)